MKALQWSLCVCFVLVANVGCDPSGLKTVPVTGKVTIGGQPADGVIVNFVPVGSEGAAASGAVKGGAYELLSGSEGKKGAVIGKYKVFLTPGAASGAMDPEAMKNKMKAQYESKPDQDQSKKGSSAPTGPSLNVPDEYLNSAKTPLEKEVKAGVNTIDIEIPAKQG